MRDIEFRPHSKCHNFLHIDLHLHSKTLLMSKYEHIAGQIRQKYILRELQLSKIHHYSRFVKIYARMHIRTKIWIERTACNGSNFGKRSRHWHIYHIKISSITTPSTILIPINPFFYLLMTKLIISWWISSTKTSWSLTIWGWSNNLKTSTKRLSCDTIIKLSFRIMLMLPNNWISRIQVFLTLFLVSILIVRAFWDDYSTNTTL